MKKGLTILIAVLCLFTLFAGEALADAPTSTSYFSSSKYNKSYTDGNGLVHTMSVTWVGETWNKVGTVIYSINYEDIYENGNNIYIDVKSETEIYENARPTYPDSSEFSVYQVKWYSNGSKTVVCDYRTASSTATPTAKPTQEPTAEPTSTPTKEPTTEPTDKPTASPTEKIETITTTDEKEDTEVNPTQSPSALIESSSASIENVSDNEPTTTISLYPEEKTNDNNEVVGKNTKKSNTLNWIVFSVIFVFAITIMLVVLFKNRKEKD